MMQAAEWWLRGEASSTSDYARYGHTGALPHLFDITLRDENWFYANNQSERIGLAVGLLNHLQTTYGSAKVVELLDALTKHHSWQAAVPEVFHITVAEFEAAWQGRWAD
ncbi:MAG: hypothetical protein R2911_30675 [Caldilineaceae bacterium]